MFRAFHKLLEIFQKVSQNFSIVLKKQSKVAICDESCLKKLKIFGSDAKICKLYKKRKTMISKHFCAILQRNQRY